MHLGKNKMTVKTMMHAGMDGPHLFRFTIKSNDLGAPETVITVRANFGVSGG